MEDAPVIVGGVEIQQDTRIVNFNTQHPRGLRCKQIA